MTATLIPWDSAAAFRSDDEIAAYVEAALEEAADTGDDQVVADALSVVARARSMAAASAHGGAADTQTASDSGPSLSQVLRRLKELRIALHAHPIKA